MRVLAGACLALGIACSAMVARAAVVVVASGRPASTAGEFDTEYGVWSLDLDADGDYDFGFSFHSGCVSSAPHLPFTACFFSREIGPRQDGQVAFTSNGEYLLAGALVGAQIDQRAPAEWTWSPLGSLTISSQFQDHGPPLKISYHKPTDPEVMDGYIAFRLPSEGEAWRYGYLHFDYRRWPLPPGGSEITGDPILVGWAYETTPNVAIRVQPIPEPTLMLLLLTSLAAGARHRRR